MSEQSFSIRAISFKQWLFVMLSALVISALLYSSYQYFVLVPQKREKDDAAKTLTAKTASYTDVTGESVTLDSFENRARVVLLWASWVPNIDTQLITLNQIASETSNNDLVFLAINRSEPPTRATAFLNTLPTLDHLTTIIDSNDNLYDSLGGYAMPETVIFDAAGIKVWHKRGNYNQEELMKALGLVTQ